MNTEQQVKTRSSTTATKVLKQVQQRNWNRSTNLDEIKQYGNLAASLPGLVRSAGLAQAIAYIEVRGTKEGQKALYDDLCVVLGWPVGTKKVAAAQIVQQDLQTYMQTTRQTLDALVWFKRFSQSVLGFDPVKDTNEGQR